VKTAEEEKRRPAEQQGTGVLDKGTRLGEYKIERLIGVGSMGAVYEAVCTATGHRHAIKVLNPALAVVPTARARFRKEAELTARVRHPHIVDITDVGEDAGRSYFVMELLNGEDLGHRLLRAGTLSVAEIVDIMLPVCDAVAEAHRRRITHRDLKPSNIFLLVRGKRPHPVVLDFGIAEDEKADGGDAGAAPARRAVFGTPYYLAPEQVGDHQTAGPASDQYALGVILYECLTGQPPYRGNKVDEVFRAIAAGNPPPPSKRGSDIPPEVDAIVLRALSVDPKARFASVAELRQALQPFSSAATGVTSGSHKRIPSRSDIEAAKTRLGMSPASEAAAKTEGATKSEALTKTRLGMSPASEVEAKVEAKTRDLSSPAIEVEKTPSPFRRTLTPEVEALDRQAAVQPALEVEALDHSDHAWFAAGDAAHEIAAAAVAAIPSAADADLYAESSGATVPPVEVDGAREFGGLARFASRRMWIGVGASVAVAGLVMMLVSRRGNSSAPTPPSAMVQIEPAAAAPAPEATPTPAPTPAPSEAPAVAAPTPAPSEAPVAAAAPAATPPPVPSEAPVAAPAPAPAPREAPAPVAAAPEPAPREEPVAAPAPAPREAPAPVATAPERAPREARAAAPTPARRKAPAPVVLTSAPSEPAVAASPAKSRSRRSEEKPRTRGGSGVRLHNGVPLLD